MKIRPGIRCIIATTAALAAVGGLAPAAAAAPTAKGEGESALSDVFRTRTMPVEFSFVSGKGLIATGAELLTQTVDDLGNAVSALTTTKLRTSAVVGNADRPQISNFTCVKNGVANRKFTTYEPRDIHVQSRAGVLQYLIEAYEQRGAREVGFSKRTQIQICTTGGADLDGGWRATQSGVGMFLADRHVTHRRGFKWPAGDNTGELTQSLSFEASGKKLPISIGASLSQGSGDRMEGSFNGPYSSVLDTYSRNAVVGWWEDGCNGGWTGCRAPTDGQDKFRGAITQGLWEFTKEELTRPQQFFISPFLKDRCPIREQPCG